MIAHVATYHNSESVATCRIISDIMIHSNLTPFPLTVTTWRIISDIILYSFFGIFRSLNLTRMHKAWLLSTIGIMVKQRQVKSNNIFIYYCDLTILHSF